ncbi:MAG: hypothetical protein K6V73_09860 [Firmicutes bacterium]|nr:hypothetical protein [Bacillota bacterium]
MRSSAPSVRRNPFRPPGEAGQLLAEALAALLAVSTFFAAIPLLAGALVRTERQAQRSQAAVAFSWGTLEAAQAALEGAGQPVSSLACTCTVGVHPSCASASGSQAEAALCPGLPKFLPAWPATLGDGSGAALDLTAQALPAAPGGGRRRRRQTAPRLYRVESCLCLPAQPPLAASCAHLDTALVTMP